MNMNVFSSAHNEIGEYDEKGQVPLLPSALFLRENRA